MILSIISSYVIKNIIHHLFYKFTDEKELLSKLKILLMAKNTNKKENKNFIIQNPDISNENDMDILYKRYISEGIV